MPIIMTISVVVILVQQKKLLKQMTELNLNTFSKNKNGKTHHHHQMKLIFSKVNHSTAQLCSAIAAYSGQWTAYLSAVVPVQVVSISNLAYVFLFSRLPLLLKYMFIFTTSALATVLFAQTHCCAMVVRLNGTYSKQSSAVARKLQKIKQLSPAEELKYQSISSVQRREFAFRFFNDHTINPGTFPLVNLLLFSRKNFYF